VKAGPEVWMDAIRPDGGARASQERALRSGEGSGFGEIAQKSLVEHLHQFRAAGVIYFPQRGQERGCPVVVQGAPSNFATASASCLAKASRPLSERPSTSECCRWMPFALTALPRLRQMSCSAAAGRYETSKRSITNCTPSNRQ